MKTMNQSEYAEHAGVNRKTIQRWIKAGKYIVMSGDLIDVQATDEALAKFRDGTDQRASNAKKKTSVKTLESRAASVFNELMSGSGVIRPIEESRAMKEHYMAELSKLEFEEKEGVLLPWQDIIEKVGVEYSRLRTRLLAIAPEHGPRLRQLALSATDAEFVKALQEVINEALEELSLDKEEEFSA